MPFWQALVIAFVPTIGVVLTVWYSTRDLKVRRRLEGTDKFFRIVMTAHARDEVRESVGIAEQIAAIHLLADFGSTEKHLRNAAQAALREISLYTSSIDDETSRRASAAATEALETTYELNRKRLKTHLRLPTGSRSK